jgi:hypothetical protein
VNNEPDTQETDETSKEQDKTSQEAPSGEAEFKVTVRKLEMPVRPRGVLAE